MGGSNLSFPRMWDLGIFIDSSIFDLLLRCSEKSSKNILPNGGLMGDLPWVQSKKSNLNKSK